MSNRGEVDGLKLSVPWEGIKGFCRRWKVARLEIFGSSLREDFSAESDVDLLVTFMPEPRWSLVDHAQMENELVTLLGREVDLVTRRAVERSTNRHRREAILSTARTLYAA